jgi:hypothetical protein
VRKLSPIDRAAARFNRWFGATAIASAAESGLPGNPTIDARAVTTLLGEFEQAAPEPQRTTAPSPRLMLAVAAFGVIVVVGATLLWILERTTAPKVYAGTTHGVVMTLRVPARGDHSTLTVHFGAKAEAVRARAAHARRLGAFCAYSRGNDGLGSEVGEVRFDPLKRTQAFQMGSAGSDADYTCGLAPYPARPRSSATSSIRRAIVAVHLTATHG